MAAEVTIYSSAYCPFCIRAKHLLNAKNVSFNEISVDGQPEVRRKMVELGGRTSVPQIWVDEYHVGGCDDLMLLERQGKLDQLLNPQPLNSQ